MAPKIYPGNYVNPIASILNQGIVGCYPGRVARHLVGYAKITTSASSWDIVIPSDDKRVVGEKTRPDQIGMVIPLGACIYRLGLRVLDARRNRDVGVATSGLVGTNAQELKLASALNVDPSAALTATALSAPAFTIANTTVTPGQTSRDALINAGVITTGGPLTLRVYNNTTADGAGAGLSSTFTEGSYVIAEACFTLHDDVPGPSAFGGLPSAAG